MNLAGFDTISIVIFLIGCINLIFGVAVYSQGLKSKEGVFFSGVVFSVFLWSLSMVFYRSFSDYVVFWAKLLYVSAALIPFFFLFFSVHFGNTKSFIKRRIEFFLLLPILSIVTIVLSKNIFIKDVLFSSTGENIIYFNEQFHLTYGLYIVTYFFIAFLILLEKYRRSESLFKTQLSYVIFGTLIAASVGSVTNLIMPYFGFFEFNWVGQIAAIFMVASIAYAVVKHQLFDVKLVVAESIIFAIGLILTIKLFFITSASELVVDVVTLIFVILLGISLIKNVKKEIKRTEHIKILLGRLKVANKKLKELDEARADFVSIASHQLRTPLTAIKGYASLILEGDYGRVPKKANEVVEKIFSSSQRLVYIVNDLLNVSRMEKGKIQYEFEKMDLVSMLKDILEELRPNAEEKNLKLKLKIREKEKTLFVSADKLKLRQVFTNIADNAIKYTDKGDIEVSLSKNKDKKEVIVCIKDSGMGIKQENIGSIFEKFKRSKEAVKNHTEGSGVGLYVAREFIKAHNGVIWVKSKGLGEGSEFFIQLPMNL